MFSIFAVHIPITSIFIWFNQDLFSSYVWERERPYDYIIVLKHKKGFFYFVTKLTICFETNWSYITIGFHVFLLCFFFFLLLIVEYVVCRSSLSLASLVISLCYAKQFLGTNIWKAGSFWWRYHITQSVSLMKSLICKKYKIPPFC